ncbi:MAG: T9SS type A sorting domain-containing protein [Saprospiraceae bacterium]
MKNKIFLPIFLMLFPLFYNNSILAQCNDLLITAVFDGPLDNEPRGIELYAKQNISDLSIFSIGSATNGGGSDGEEFMLPTRSVNAGTFLYISKDSASFHDFFGFTLDNDLMPSTNASVGFLDGDDAIELFCNGVVVDIFGAISHNTTGLDWNYENGWAYRLNGTGNGGANFKRDNWIVDRNALDDETTNATAAEPVPLGTYDTFPACDRLLITGIYDGPLPGGEPQGVELFVTKDIPDLSLFGFGSITNGNGSSGVEVDFPRMSVKANTFLYITSDSAAFHDFFGFAPTIETSSANINGDDAVELFCQQGTPTVIDVFGDINVDGTGTAWAYTDGWAYRKKLTLADGNTFMVNNWDFGGLNALKGGMTNNEATTRFPIGTYQSTNTTNCPEDRQLMEGELVEGTYSVVNTLRSKSTIPTGGNVTFQAGQAIKLEAGFYAKTGSQFLAEIATCSTNIQENRTESTIFERALFNNNKISTAVTIPTTFDFQIYPNPSTTHLTVDFLLQERTTIQLQLLEITGRIVKILQPKQTLEKGAQQLLFDISELNAGMYWLRLDDVLKVFTKRLVIAKQRINNNFDIFF